MERFIIKQTKDSREYYFMKHYFISQREGRSPVCVSERRHAFRFTSREDAENIAKEIENSEVICITKSKIPN